VGAAGACTRPILSRDPISRKIARRISAEGPLSIAAFMAMALHDPEDGYYAWHSPIGAQGDYVTAPEISQVFGELIGLWCAVMWQRLGEPDPIILAELGPGRGVLIEDLLRAAAAIPTFRRALRLYLVEASPALRAEQEARLAGLCPVWVSRFEDLPEGPMLLVANEFLDALPIRQFARGRGQWSERMVALDDDNRFVLVDGPESPAASLLVPEALRVRAQPDSVVEVCPAALSIAAGLGARFARRPGAALFIDYGYYLSAPGSTLRAVHRHRAVSPLAAPGTADLSAHVDFAALIDAARAGGAATYGPVSQRHLLTALGAQKRAAALRARATPSRQQALDEGVRRLLDADEMGTLFKAIALTLPGMPPPPGFAADPR
jgi:NADH dehydrogenase [ubiquinone] 1 alpha subcomplex assembly factor 7